MPSPQPLLWFDPALTYNPQANKALDERIVESLNAAHVDVIIIERVSWLGTEMRLQDFPLLAEYMRTKFSLLKTIGNFDILGRNTVFTLTSPISR